MNYISAALTVVAGLAWNDAVKSTLNKYVDAVGDDLLGKYIYAVMITLITIVAIYMLTELNTRVKNVLPAKASDLISMSEPSTVINPKLTQANLDHPLGILNVDKNTKIFFVPVKADNTKT